MKQTEYGKKWQSTLGSQQAKDILGTSGGGGRRIKEACWWNDEVKEEVKEKQEAYAAIINTIAKENSG